MLERDLQKGVIDVAKILGYRVMHARPAWTGKGYRTAIQGHAGFPDLCIVGNGRLLFRELKAGKGTLSSEQAEWIRALEAAGADVGVWTDEDWSAGLIEADLRRGTRHEEASAA